MSNAATIPIEPIKPMLIVPNAETVPKKPIKPIPQESWGPVSQFPRLLRNWFYCFFWYSCSIWHYQDWFYWFLLGKTNKTNPDSAKCWNCTKKNNKTNSSGVLRPSLPVSKTPGELVLLFFLVQLQHFATLGLVLLVLLVQLQHFDRFPSESRADWVSLWQKLVTINHKRRPVDPWAHTMLWDSWGTIVMVTITTFSTMRIDAIGHTCSFVSYFIWGT